MKTQLRCKTTKKKSMFNAQCLTMSCLFASGWDSVLDVYPCCVSLRKADVLSHASFSDTTNSFSLFSLERSADGLCISPECILIGTNSVISWLSCHYYHVHFTHSHDLYWLCQTDLFQEALHPPQYLLLSEMKTILEKARWDEMGQKRGELYLVNGKLYSCVFILCDLFSTSNLLSHTVLRGLKHTVLI